MIVLERITLPLGDFSLRDVSLRVGRGEYVVIMGPSGAGKTVLLETIAGLREPGSGRILLGGNDAAAVSPEERGIAIVYQDYSLFPHMTVYDNVAFALRFRNCAEPEIRQRVMALLEQFGVSSLSDRYPASMSGGEQQRVALARALAADPKILLLDEPFAALDPRTREECMRMVLAARKSRGLTILQVSHSREEAFALGDRIALMMNGSVLEVGTPDKIFHNPVTPAVADYTGIENIFTGIIRSTNGAFSEVQIRNLLITLKGAAPAETPVTFFIDSETIDLVREQDVPFGSRLNVIPGIVADILPAEHRSKIRLEGEITLVVTISRENIPVLSPLPGEPLIARFSPESVHIFHGGA